MKKSPSTFITAAYICLCCTPVFPYILFCMHVYFSVSAECRILQFGQMSMSSEEGGDQRVTKANVEAVGDQGLLSLLTDDTVFYVGGYPSTFKVSTSRASLGVTCKFVVVKKYNIYL